MGSMGLWVVGIYELMGSGNGGGLGGGRGLGLIRIQRLVGFCRCRGPGLVRI